MGKSERIEESRLPEEMIQHIQSFLSGKEGVRTSIFSRSWYYAWLTHPDLGFSEVDIPDKNWFVNFGKKTMQRYVKLNQKIRSFKVVINSFSNARDKIFVANEWTRMAMKLGATNIDIKILLGSCFTFRLPHEVLASESLVRLSLDGCRIDRHEVRCWRLKSLTLCEVVLEGDMMWDIISMCPLIEELALSKCGHSNSYIYKRLGVNDFRKLKVLCLAWVEIGEWLFSDLSSKFSSLKELSLQYCSGYEEIQICSNSLECIVLCHRLKLRVKLDVPRIRKFKFEGRIVPSLSFKTTSREWESHISFMCILDSSWFLKFTEFLLELSSSKINLHLLIRISLVYARHMINLRKPPTVEKLELQMDAPVLVQSSLLEDLFQSCRPKFIILHWSPIYVKNYDIVKLICNTLMEKECTLHDLEEVNVDVCGCTVWTWRQSLPSNTLDASALSEWIETQVSCGLQFLFSREIDASASWDSEWINKTKICLHFKWR